MNVHSLPPSQKSLFTRWRWSVYISMFFGWSCHILIRKNLPSTMSSLIKHQGFTHSDIGKISSSFAVAYGWSKFIGALISDHASPQKIFSAGLILVGLCSLVFPLAYSVTIACVVWLVAGIVQGFGWPPCVILLKSWYPPSHMGRMWSLLSCAGNVASASLPFLVIYITSVSHWSMCYYSFGISALVMGIIVLFTIRDSPADIGLATFHSSPKKKDRKDEKDNPGINWYKVFFIRDLWIVSAVYAILYLVNYCTLNWSQLYFDQEAGFSQTVAAGCYSFYQIGSIFGNFFAGYMSDLFITPKTVKCQCPRAPFLLVVSVLLYITLHLFRTTVTMGTSEVWASVLMFVLGQLTCSGVVVIGLCAMEVVSGDLVGSAHGLACAVAQAGAFFAGWPFSFVLENYGWNRAYYVVELFLIVMVVLCAFLLTLLLTGMKKQKLS